MPTGDGPATTESRSTLPWQAWALLGLFLAVVVALRLSGPSDLLDNDQLGPAAYAVDVVTNGQWIVQRDTSGDVASKPPLTTWIIAIASLAMGDGVTRLALAVPSILGLAGMAALTLHLGARYIGARAAWWSVLALVLSPMGFKQAILVRTDSFYGFAGALCAWALWEAVHRRRSAWVWFWIAVTVATLTKGPVAALLALGGLLAWVWPKDSGAAPGRERDRRVRADLVWHALGVAMLVACAGGWVYLAWRDSGSAFIDKIFGRELVGHMVTSVRGKPPLAEFYLPVLYYLGRFAPGSVLTAIGLWAVMARPAADPTTRRFERFVWWWFVVGLVVFSIAPHQRPDLMTPIWVAGSLLAGRTMADLVRAIRITGQLAIAGVWVAAGLVGGVLEHHVHAGRKPEVRAERAIRAFGDALLHRFDGPPPLAHVSENSSLQLYLGRRVNRTAEAEALMLLAGDAPCAVAVSRKSGLEEAARARGIEMIELSRSPDAGKWDIVILGNAAAAADPRWLAGN